MIMVLIRTHGLCSISQRWSHDMLPSRPRVHVIVDQMREKVNIYGTRNYMNCMHVCTTQDDQPIAVLMNVLMFSILHIYVLMNPFTENPPSMGIMLPVTYEDASIQRKDTTDATSRGSPTRPIGVLEMTCALYSSFRSTSSASGVPMYHGATAFTRMLSLAHSQLRLRVS